MPDRYLNLSAEERGEPRPCPDYYGCCGTGRVAGGYCECPHGKWVAAAERSRRWRERYRRRHGHAA